MMRLFGRTKRRGGMREGNVGRRTVNVSLLHVWDVEILLQSLLSVIFKSQSSSQLHRLLDRWYFHPKRRPSQPLLSPLICLRVITIIPTKGKVARLGSLRWPEDSLPLDFGAIETKLKLDLRVCNCEYLLVGRHLLQSHYSR
jgi:hypothetical protein